MSKTVTFSTNLINSSSSSSNNNNNYRGSGSFRNDERVKNELLNTIDEIKSTTCEIKRNLNNIKDDFMDIQEREGNQINSTIDQQPQQQLQKQKTTKQIELENLIESYSNLSILEFDDYYVPDNTTTTTTTPISPFIKLSFEEKLLKVKELEERLNTFDFTSLLKKIVNDSNSIKSIEEYKKFVIVKSIEGDEMDEKLSPSNQIAKLLQLHIQDDRENNNYQQMLNLLEMTNLKFKPQRVTRIKYERTLDLIKKYFNLKKLNSHIWPPNYLK